MEGSCEIDRLLNLQVALFALRALTRRLDLHKAWLSLWDVDEGLLDLHQTPPALWTLFCQLSLKLLSLVTAGAVY